MPRSAGEPLAFWNRPTLWRRLAAAIPRVVAGTARFIGRALGLHKPHVKTNFSQPAGRWYSITPADLG